MECFFFALPFFFLTIVHASTTNNSYVITVPETFRPGMLVKMDVLILKVDQPGTPVDVNATFFVDSVPVASAAGQYHKGVLGFLKIQIPSHGIPESRYSRKHLQVFGSGGLTFKTESHDIRFDRKGLSIYVQTDKGIYKPGQTVYMRVLGVYPDLKVYTGKISISITDPKDNKLAYWKDEMTTSGVITKEFELSSQPNMGNWKISVEIEGRNEETTFEVKEYVLPKFKVDVVTNTYASAGDGDVKVSVTAKYTYGKMVKGTASMMVKPQCYSFYHWHRKTSCHEYSRVFKIDGTHSLVIPKKEIVALFSYDPYRDYSLYINVSVTDELTGKIQFGEASVRLYSSSIILKYSESNPKAFKPGFPFEALVEVTRPDKTPVTSGKIKVQITTSTRPETPKVEKTYTVDENGYVTLKQSLPLGIDTLIIQGEASDEYGKKGHFSETLKKFKSKSNTFLRLTANEYEVKASEEIVCSVSATEAFSVLTYLVLSRGNTILSNSVVNSPKGKTATLKFLATSIMSPSAKVVAYFVRHDGEIVADSVTIKVNGAFENEVSVNFSSAVQRPGESVDVTIKASPYSHVGLLAVDQSVLLLKKDNDFSVEQVMQELNSYGGDSGSFPPWWRWRRRRSFFPWYPAADSSREIFQRAGVVVLTDCEEFKTLSVIPFMMFETSALDTRRMMEKTATAAGGNPGNEVKKVRTFFPETWLWKNVKTNSAGHAQVSATSPDTITSWVLSGFAVSNVTGFGVANEKPQLRVFQPFFVSMDLPYSVIRGEQVAIKVLVFNYETADMEVTVTLESSDGWKNFVETANNVIDGKSNTVNVVSVIKVPGNSGSGISFPIIPTKLGSLPITVRARSATSSDAVKRNLFVEPEGVEQEYSYSLLLDFTSSSTFTKELELALPPNVIEGSAKATVSVIGDIMGSSISGIEKLLKMPYGCGEQNMINFAPSMFIRAYLEAVDQLTPNILSKSVKFMTSGYQRELSYQHHDGSYSAFGERYGQRRPGSLWLTAFVVKSFSRAKDYVYIDPVSLQKSINFILTQQKDGSFKESGRVSSYLQGGLKSSNPEALTAYVLVSLLESNNSSPKVAQSVSNAVQFLKQKLPSVTDVYTLTIMAYAFELADDPAKETVLNKLLKLAVREDGTMHWTEKKSAQQTERPWFRPYYRPRSSDIEMTSYVLLVYAHRRDRQNGLPIARWLAQQRNSLGGYSSTQDTVIGLQALSEFAPLIFSPDISFTVDVKLSSDTSYDKSFKVNKDNMIVLQQDELPSVKGKLQVSGRGKGLGVLQIGVTYNVDKAPTDKSFNLVVQVISADNNRVETRSCVTYAGDEDKSGMAIMEFGLPSGFTVDQDEVNELLSNEKNKIKRIETPGRKAVLYFDEVLKTEELCVNLKSVRTFAVGKAQPIPVVVYDYYKPEKRATTMYATQDNVGLCDVCTDCTGCKPRPTGPGDRASHIISFSQFLMILLAFMMYNFY